MISTYSDCLTSLTAGDAVSFPPFTKRD